MAEKPKYVVVSDAEEGSCGSMTFWAMSGDTLRETLNLALESAGLARITMPRVPVKLALQRALGAVYAGHGVKVVSLDRTRYTCQLETKRPGERRVTYAQLCVAEVTSDGVKLEYNMDGHVDRTEEIARQYEYERSHLSSGDISGWLARLLDGLNAQSMRPGLYFVPKQAVPIVLQIVKILKECGGHDVSRLPIMATEEVTRTVLAAVTEEARKAMEAVDNELNDATELTDRGRRGKLDALASVKAKIVSFEKCFGLPLAEVNGMLESLRCKIAGTVWKAEAAEQGRDMEGQRPIELDDTILKSEEDDAPDAAVKRFTLIETDDGMESASA